MRTSYSVVVVRSFSEEHLPPIIDSAKYLPAAVGDIIDITQEPEDCVTPQRTWVYGRKRGTDRFGWIPSTYTVMLQRCDGPLYSLPYEEQLWLENRCLTRFLESAINYLLHNKRYATEGIFRCNGDKRMESWIMAHVARAGSIDFEHIPGVTPHSVADTIKFYLKSLPESIIPPRFLMQVKSFLMKCKDDVGTSAGEVVTPESEFVRLEFNYDPCRWVHKSPDQSGRGFVTTDIVSASKEKYAFFFEESSDILPEASSSLLGATSDEQSVRGTDSLSLRLSMTPWKDHSESREALTSPPVEASSRDTGTRATKVTEPDLELTHDAFPYEGTESEQPEHNSFYNCETVTDAYLQQSFEEQTGTDAGNGSSDNSVDLLFEDGDKSSAFAQLPEILPNSGSMAVIPEPVQGKVLASREVAAAEFIFDLLPLSRFILLRSIMILCCHIMEATETTKMTPKGFKQVFYTCILNDPNNSLSISVSQKLTEFLFTNWRIFEEYYEKNGIPRFDPALPLARCHRKCVDTSASLENILICTLATFDPTDYIGISNSNSCIRIERDDVVVLIRVEGEWALVSTGKHQGWVDLACLQYDGLFCLVEAHSLHELESLL